MGSRVGLRPILESDYELLRIAELSEHLGARWRFRGATPSPEMYAQALWQGVLAQFLVVERRNPEPIGVVTAYNADSAHGYVYLAAAGFRPRGRSSSLAQGVALFVNYLFSSWPLRKIYLETTSDAATQFPYLQRRLLVEEACFREHVAVGTRLVDLHVFALYRDVWDEIAGRLLRFVLGYRGERDPSSAPVD